MNYSISQLVNRARAAQKIAENFSQRQVDELAAALVYKFSRKELAETIAKETNEETQLGTIQAKINKLTKKMPASLYFNLGIKSVGVIEEDREKGLTRIAKPIGVIAALIPSTNPEATPIFDGFLSIRGRNAIIFAPHPASKKITTKIVNIMRDVLDKNGVPKDLFLVIEEPSKAISQELMASCDLTFATGGASMVKAANASGKPVYGAGTGNCPSVVDETADLPDAAHKIMIGKTGDNASGCSAENSIIIYEEVYDDMLGLLQKEGGYLANSEEKLSIQKVLWVDGQLNKKIIARPVLTIAKEAGIKIPQYTKFIIVEENGVGEDFPFSGEKLSLILTAYKYSSPFSNAIALANEITEFCGLGHSVSIHSYNKEHILEYALKTKTSRVTVRQPNGGSNAGSWNNGLPNTFSLGCGTWGGYITSDNISQKHFLNNTWVSVPIHRNEFPEKDIYGDLLENIQL